MKKKGIWIDSNLSGYGLSPLDKFLYSQIVYYAERAGFCIKTDKSLSEELEVSESSIKRSLDFLEKKGFLKRDTDKSGGNVRRLTPSVKMNLPFGQNEPTPSVKMNLPFGQNEPTYKEEIINEQLNKQLLNNISDSDRDFLNDVDLKDVHEKAPQTGGPANETNFPFEIIWGMYGKKGSAKVSKQRYEKLKENIRETIFEHVPKYVASTPELKYRKNFEVYLNQETYNDQIIEYGSSTKTVYRSSKNETSQEYLSRVGSEIGEALNHHFGLRSNEFTASSSSEFDNYTDFTNI